MRRRVLLATISAVAVAVLLLGVPLGIFGARYVGAIEQQRISDRVATLARSVDGAIERDELPSDAEIGRAHV